MRSKLRIGNRSFEFQISSAMRQIRDELSHSCVKIIVRNSKKFHLPLNRIQRDY